MTRYYTLVEGTLVPLKTPALIGGHMVLHPTAKQAASIGAYPLADNQPPDDAPPGKHYEQTGWDVEGGQIVCVYTLVNDPPPALEDYDAAMEEHLRREREERGYTTREPDSYRDSSVPRWAADARDWVAHRDDVMGYAIGILNAVQSGEMQPPTLAAFVAGLPHITWTED